MKVKMSDIADGTIVAYDIGHQIEIILAELYPNYYGQTDPSRITDKVIQSVADKFKLLNCTCIGDYESEIDCANFMVMFVKTYVYANADYLSFLNEDKMSTIPKENIMQIIRSGESTNKTMGEDTPMTGSADFGDFTIDSPSAKAISRNEANGTDTHKDNSIDNYIKRQRAYENFISYANWIENIFRMLTVDYNVAY